MTRYAEVIGDPIDHSLSPAIHRHWLAVLGLSGAFHATHVTPDELADLLDNRRRDPEWRGCSITSPHKRAILPLLDVLTEEAASIGAVNCVYRDRTRLVGTNTDLAGVGHALAGTPLAGAKALLIGAGGAARAVIAYLTSAGVADIVLLVRDPTRAAPLLRPGIRFAPLARAAEEAGDARLIVNASPLGMAGAPPLPPSVLHALDAASGMTVMDLVYAPLETDLLAAARTRQLRTVDGLEMLIGQARRAFEHFFGAEPLADDALRRRLTGR